MLLREAITICKEMQKWRRGDYEDEMPYKPSEFGEAIDTLIELGERQLEMEDDMERFKKLLSEQ